MTHPKKSSDENPWYKQTWFWFVISIPLLTIVAGVITYQIAADKPHSMVVDNYFKRGLALNRSLDKQKMATQLGVSAVLNLEQNSQLLSVILDYQIKPESIEKDQPLVLTFSHPTQEKHDKKIFLSALSENEYIAELPPLVATNWHIHLTDSAEQWELKSRLEYPSQNQLKIFAKVID